MSPEATTESSQGAPGQDPLEQSSPGEERSGMPGGGSPGLGAVDFPEIGDSLEAGNVTRGDPERNIELLKDVNLRVKVELGRGKMLLRDVLRLVEGSVVELDKLAGDPLDIYVNDRLVGKGEVLVLNENFCVRITQVFSPEECLRIKEIS